MEKKEVYYIKLLGFARDMRRADIKVFFSNLKDIRSDNII